MRFLRGPIRRVGEVVSLSSTCAALLLSCSWSGYVHAQDVALEEESYELEPLVVTADPNTAKKKKPSATLTPEITVVTATRTEESIETLGSSVSVLGRAEIEASGERTVIGILNRVPGVYATQIGGVGANSSVRIRGADSDQTLVLIDGMRVNDPSSPGGDFDFASLALTDVERIEVLKGPQSAVWGGDAIGGVINIVTRKGDGPPTARASVEGGSYGTYKVGAGLSGGTERGHYAISGTFLQTDGFSRNKLGSEKDGAEIFTFSGRGGYRVAPNYQVNFAAHVSNLDADTDPSLSSASGDGPGTSERFLFSGQIDNIVTTMGGRLEHKVSLSSLYGDREATNPRNAMPTTYYRAESYGLEYQGTFRATDALTLTFGSRYQQDQASNEVGGSGLAPISQFDDSIENLSGYAQAAWTPVDNLNLSLAGRSDDFGMGGVHNTWRATGSYLFEATSTRFHASYGTGAKPPTMYQAFFNGADPIFGGTLVGNPDLDVETSQGYDVGVEQSFFDQKLKFDVTYFKQDIENLIIYQNVIFGVLSTYENVDNVASEGVEVSAAAQLLDWVSVTGAYTYMGAQDQADGNDLARTPRNVASLGLQVTPIDRLSLGAEVMYVGRQFNLSRERDELDAFTRVNLNGTWQLDETTQVFGRIDNLFDVDYETVRNAGEAGRSGYLGVRMSLN
ncbi:TonB-dependent receptor [Hyphomicrobium sp. CS1GBMeth3]|uniref:TonB-dependent receptor plug domain-containing protein n=1 Tax=Hyphomicrobium sp. CS1GBMeth3 TaxID=1892845 RepID=UPI0009FB8CF2|nr:TonB-dependent receptor [Hyphomicrobium sp. CS1GBMeth3]